MDARFRRLRSLDESRTRSAGRACPHCGAIRRWNSGVQASLSLLRDTVIPRMIVRRHVERRLSLSALQIDRYAFSTLGSSWARRNPDEAAAFRATPMPSLLPQVLCISLEESVCGLRLSYHRRETRLWWIHCFETSSASAVCRDIRRSLLEPDISARWRLYGRVDLLDLASVPSSLRCPRGVASEICK